VPDVTLTPGPGIPSGLWYKAGPDARIHPTAIVEQGVAVGRGTAVWDCVHVRRDAKIGDECIIGEKAYIAYEVRVGHRCKVGTGAYLCAGVTLEDGVLIAPHVVFSNDRHPRATTPDLSALVPSTPADRGRPILVKEGASVGSNCTVGDGLTIGRWAMVGMGSVVTRSVPDFALAVGSPAVPVGAVCRCGQVLLRHPPGRPPERQPLTCGACGRGYLFDGGTTTEAEPGS
jgi:UDP-2-acetamido-3-amino-2,3-dideoxy-glucuronate N-acetyltransferase